ncbi:MAG TPA: isovaleryl-CoA dehydrogenase [Acidobacteriota bacterium]|nr:isovaleryl-CoA dehydrogenase [Acidobacteriota bacterium]
MSNRAANQPPPLEGYNLFTQDRVLREAVEREGGGWVESQALELGEWAGRPETLRLGHLANRYPPVLHTHDRFGERIDQVEYHPAWHEMMRVGIERGTHSLPWTSPRPGANVARAALMMLRHQVDEGPSCPLTMTFAVIPSLRLQPELAREWEPKVLSSHYDPSFKAVGDKRGALFGMAMTERQGGSDVRANTTQAEPLGGGGPGGEYVLTGHKWFCSAPMCDAFLVLAQAPGGLSCFLLPRWTPDGRRNAFHIQRLKDKLGNRSNASSEVEFEAAWARLLGEEGRGVPTIIEMVRHTRLDCVLGAASTMRRAAAEALHHAHYRRAFGRRLSEQPLMQNVLADLALESEAATALALRLARGFDESASHEAQKLFTRLATPLAKYWVTKRVAGVAAEALECIGGNGYVEEAPMSRLYRDAPLNSLWEGAGNIQCLDVLRVLAKEKGALEALLAELRSSRGGNAAYDGFLEQLEDSLEAPSESQARVLAESLAVALQAALLVRHSPSAVSDAFCASRLSPQQGRLYGTLPASVDFATIISRARPRL